VHPQAARVLVGRIAARSRERHDALLRLRVDAVLITFVVEDQADRSLRKPCGLRDLFQVGGTPGHAIERSPGAFALLKRFSYSTEARRRKSIQVATPEERTMRSPFAYAATDLAPSNRADTSKRVALEVVDKRRTIVEAIDRTQLFAALPPEARVFLAERAEIRRYKQGELVGSQGTGRGAMFCVVSGRLRGIKYSPEGRRLIYMHLDPGQWAGFYWAEDDGTAVMDTEAAEPSVCVLIAGDVLAIAGRRWPALYERLY